MPCREHAHTEAREVGGTRGGEIVGGHKWGSNKRQCGEEEDSNDQAVRCTGRLTHRQQGLKDKVDN